MKLFVAFIICIQTVVGEKKEDPTAQVYEKITTLRISSLQASIRIKPHSESFVRIELNGNHQEKKAVSAVQKDNDLMVSSSYTYPDNIQGTSYMQMTVFIPDKCRVHIELENKSHGFISAIDEAVEAILKDKSEITIDSCKGLVLKQQNSSKSHIKNVNGNLLIEANNDAGILIDDGDIETSLLDLKESSAVLSKASHHKMELKTHGKPKVELESVTTAFHWSGRADEKVHIVNLSGAVEIQAAYGSEITVDNANIQNLFASTAANGKIHIKGKVEKAFCSTRGLGTIEIEEVTKFLKKTSESKRGPIKVGKAP